MIVSSKIKNKYYILEMKSEEDLTYSFLSCIEEHNGMFAVLDFNNEIKTIQKSIEEAFDYLNIKDVLKINNNIENIEDFAHYHYGYKDEERYIKKSLIEINEEYDKISENISIKISKLKEFLENKNESYINTLNEKSKNRLIENINDLLFWKIPTEDHYGIYDKLINIKSYIKNNKEFYDFVINNFGKLNNKESYGYQELLYKI